MLLTGNSDLLLSTGHANSVVESDDSIDGGYCSDQAI